MLSLRNSALVTWMAPGARTRPLQNFDKCITYIKKNITIFVFVRSGWRVFKNMRIVQSHGRQHKEKRWCTPRCRAA